MRTVLAMLFFLLVVAVAAACNYTPSGQCRPNASGDAASGDVGLPGAGVGSGPTGGDFAEPPSRPQDYGGDEPDPCNAGSDRPTKPIPTPTATPRHGDCVVTWRAGSDVCRSNGVENKTCTTEYQTAKRYAELDDARADCENAYGVGAGSGAAGCTCGWLDPGVGPSTVFWCSAKALCWPEGDPRPTGFLYSTEINAGDKEAARAAMIGWSAGECAKFAAPRKSQISFASVACEGPGDKPNAAVSVYYCNGNSICETTDDGPKTRGGCTYSNYKIDASSPQDAADRANIACAVSFQKQKAPGRRVSCISPDLACKAGGDAPN